MSSQGGRWERSERNGGREGGGREREKESSSIEQTIAN